jgi:hypothetical protein
MRLFLFVGADRDVESNEKMQGLKTLCSQSTAVRRPGAVSRLAWGGVPIDSGYHDTGAERAG